MNKTGNYFIGELHLKQTHMKLRADSQEAVESAKDAVINTRVLLEHYIFEHPDFISSLDPLEMDPNAPKFIRNMIQAGLLADVGPMAAVAGGLSEVATNAMLANHSRLALAENGGDISIKGVEPITIGVYAGENSIAKKVGFKIKPGDLPLGVCTSAGLVGHSLSFGDADAVIIFSTSAFLSDASATSVANLVKSKDPEMSIQNALEKAESIVGLKGCMIFIGELVGKTGKIPEMVEVIDSDV